MSPVLNHFKNGQMSVENQPFSWISSTSRNEQISGQIRGMVKANGGLIVWKITNDLEISIDSMRIIIFMDDLVCIL